VLEVVSTGCHQRGLELPRPLLVGSGKSPHLIGGQAKVTKRRAESLTGVDRVQELLPYVGEKPRLCSGSAAGSLSTSLCACRQLQWQPRRHPPFVPCKVTTQTLTAFQLACFVGAARAGYPSSQGRLRLRQGRP
jgi:hypothetical protein